MLDIERPGYPLPCDPVSGLAWWRWNLALCGMLPNWREWQGERQMRDIIPVLRFVVHGPIPQGDK